MRDRRFLTTARTGNGSLRPTWLAGRGSRSWDIIVSDYDDDLDHGIARLDTVAVARTRPIGGPNNCTRRPCGQSPLVEARTQCKKHDIDPKIVIHHAVDRNSRPLTAGRGHCLFDLRLFLGWMTAMRQSPDRGRGVRRTCKSVAHTLSQTPYRIVDLNAASL